MKPPPEKLGSFFIGSQYDLDSKEILQRPVSYDARDLTTHAICFGMTGSGKTGLCIGILEEAAIDKVPAIIIDPKGDITNLLLQFPDLMPDDFRPWVNPDDARRKNMSMDEYSRYISEKWREGLGDWGIQGDRIRELGRSTEFSIYTPGSDAGERISILGSLKAPKMDFTEHSEEIREQISGTVAALMALADIKEDPVRSREGILLSNIFEHFWKKGEDIDLTKLIMSIQDPPMKKLGIFDLDTFYPSKDRFDMALSFNSIVASPSFQSWLEGDAMDIGRILYNENGKPRHSIFYIAHLSEKERMFFVTLLLENLLNWSRQQSGTTSLRALLYFDETFGFMPPVAEPSSKRPLMTLLKQARAFGLGIMLVTQNPGDIDYKGLTNIGTWFIGKLQAERDKDKVLQGLRGKISGGAPVDYDALINQLDSRVFLMHSVHNDQPTVFNTRWAMSYLRGPLTKTQVRTLMKGRTGHHEPASREGKSERKISPMPHHDTGPNTQPPLIDPKIIQAYLPLKVEERDAIRQMSERLGHDVGASDTVILHEPMILGAASVRYYDKKKRISEVEDVTLAVLPPENAGIVDWSDSEPLQLGLGDVSSEPDLDYYQEKVFFSDIPEDLDNVNAMKKVKKGLSDWLYHNKRLQISTHPGLKVYQGPKEDHREFMVRLEQKARELRDVEVDKLEEKYKRKFDRLETKLEKLDLKLEADKAEYDARKKEEMVGMGESVIGFFMGRRSTRSASTITRKRRLTAKAKREIGETAKEIENISGDIKELEKELKEATDEIVSEWENVSDDIAMEDIRPRRTDIDVKMVALAWAPYWSMAETNGDVSIPAYKKEK